MRKWPPVEFGHVFRYYVERPEIYTKKQLLQRKSMDGYNYFKSGHVRKVKIWEIDSPCCILMTKVNPSQKSPDKSLLCFCGCKTIWRDNSLSLHKHGWVSYHDQDNGIYLFTIYYVRFVCFS